MRRVVVTGMGLLTSIGNNKEITWNNLISAKSGIKIIKHFDVSNLPAKIAGYINNNSEDEHYFNEKSFLDTRDINRNDRFIQYGLVAAEMAIEDAGLISISDEDKLRIGVSVGSGIGGLETIYEGSLTINNKEPKKDGREYTELRVNKRVLEIVDSPTFNVNMLKN